MYHYSEERTNTRPPFFVQGNTVMAEDERSSEKTDKSFEIAKDIHSLFLEAMEERYKDILSFLAFVLPALTGFVGLAYQYETGDDAKKELAFFVGSIATVGVLFWGGAYSLATSYRYRYLQASVYRIEESTGAAKFVPRSFKPAPIRDWAKRAGMSMAPGILQIHVFFFIVTIAGVGLAYFVVGREPWYCIGILACAAVSAGSIFLLGAFHYPRKLNALIDDLRDSYRLFTPNAARHKLILLTGPSGVGKSTLRDHVCRRRGITATPAVTTRPQRQGEKEIHRTISRRRFQRLVANDRLCLVAENHGHRYGYLRASLESPSDYPAIVEVDSKTAIENRDRFHAVVVRVLPGSAETAERIIENQKSDGREDRLSDLRRQTAPAFVEERRKAGDVVFVNRYDKESMDRFSDLVDTLTTEELP